MPYARKRKYNQRKSSSTKSRKLSSRKKKYVSRKSVGQTKSSGKMPLALVRELIKFIK